MLKDRENGEKWLPIIVGAIPFFLPFFTELNTQDVWLHSTIGKWIVENGELPELGILSFLGGDEKWLSHSWLSQVIFYLVIDLGGISGLYAFKFLILSTTFYFIVKYIRKQQLPTADRTLLLLLISGSFIQINYSFRTQSFIQLAMLWYLSHSQGRIGKTWIRMFLDFSVLIVCINLHALGILLLILYILFYSEDFFSILKEEWSIPTALLLIFIIFMLYAATPYGIKYWEYLYLDKGLFSVTDKVIVREWLSPFAMINYKNLESISFFILAIWGLYSLIVRIKERDIKSITLLIVAFVLGASAVRFIPISAILMLPAFCRIKWSEKYNKSLLSMLSLCSVIFLVVSIVFGMSMNLRGERVKLGIGLNRNFYPKKILDFLAPLKGKGNILAPVRWGGVLMWEEFTPIIDQRLELFPYELQKIFVLAYSEPDLLQELVDEYRPLAIVAGTMESPLIFNNVKTLRPKYDLFYFNDFGALFIKEDLLNDGAKLKCASLIVNPSSRCEEEWRRLEMMGGVSNLIRLRKGEDVKMVLKDVSTFEYSALHPFVIFNLAQDSSENEVKSALCRHVNWRHCFELL